MKKIIVFILLMVMTLMSVSCGDPQSEEPIPPTPDTPTTVDPMMAKNKGVISVDESKYLIKDGKTDYVLIVPEVQSSDMNLAVYDFTSLYKMATGFDITIVKDTGYTYTKDSKVISLGNNKVAEAVGLDTSNLTKKHDVKLKTIDQSIFVAGGSDEGVNFAVYELLEVLFDYEYYGANCLQIEKSVRELNLPIFDYEYRPTFTYRLCWGSTIHKNTTALRRLRCIPWIAHDSLSVITSPSHNCQEFVKDDLVGHESYWIAKNNDNLCYSARGNLEEFELMTDSAAEKLKKVLMIGDEKAFKVSISNYDGVPACNCVECARLEKKYHSATSAQILWCNRVMEKVVEWWNTEEGKPYRNDDFVFGISAYMSTDTPPTFYNEETGKYEGYDGIKCHENVVINFSPIYYDFTHSIYSNKEYYDKFQGWSAISQIHLWGYDMNFQGYFEPYDTFDYYQEFVQFVSTLNCDWFMLEGNQRTNTETSVWANLKTYLLAKLMWNKDVNVRELTEKFFKNYYGPVADQMYDMYLQSRAHTSYLKAEFPDYTGRYSCNTISSYEIYWPKQLLLKWKYEFNQMVEDLEFLKEEDPEMYHEYYRRIAPEYASPLFLLLQIYRDTLDSEVLAEVKAEFKYLMTNFWFWGERGTSVSDMLAGFGID